MCLPDICRACMVHEPGMTSIFKPTVGTPIDIMIISITSINPLPHDGLPSQICKHCLDMLKQCFTFRQRIIKSDIKFRQAQTSSDFLKSSKCGKTGDTDSSTENSVLAVINLCERERDSESSHESSFMLDDKETIRNDLSTENQPQQTQIKVVPTNIRGLKIVQVIGDYDAKKSSFVIDEPLRNREFSTSLKYGNMKSKENMELFSDKDITICLNNENKAKRQKVISTNWKIDLLGNDEIISQNESISQTDNVEPHDIKNAKQCDIEIENDMPKIEVYSSNRPPDDSLDEIDIEEFHQSQLQSSPPLENKKFKCIQGLVTKDKTADEKILEKNHPITQEGKKKRKHVKDNEFCCKLCNFKGVRIKRHLAGHLIERPYLCKMCSGTYPRLDYFEIHKRICTGKTIYTCKECNTQFVWKKKFLNHLTTESGGAECLSIQRSRIISLEEYDNDQLLQKFYTKRFSI